MYNVQKIQDMIRKLQHVLNARWAFCLILQKVHAVLFAKIIPFIIQLRKDVIKSFIYLSLKIILWDKVRNKSKNTSKTKQIYWIAVLLQFNATQVLHIVLDMDAFLVKLPISCLISHLSNVHLAQLINSIILKAIPAILA